MPDYILLRRPDESKWERAIETDLDNEEALRQLVKDNPDILPLHNLGDDTPPLLIVGREAPLQNGYADVIGIDNDGLITVIECKLERNPEVKRTIIGQIIGYGAYLWQMSYDTFEQQIVRPYFDDSARCHRDDLAGVSLADAMQRFCLERAVVTEWTEADFRERVEESLGRGRMRLVIVVDRVNDELRRSVEFVNACTAPNFQIVCAELGYYRAGGLTLLVPTLIGVSKTATPASTPRRGDEPSFVSALETRSGLQAVTGARRVIAWSKANLDWQSWGNGKVDRSFIAGLQWGPNHFVTPMAIYSNGRIEIGFEYMKRYPPFTDEARRRQLLDQINTIPGIHIADDAFNRRPSFPVSVLADDAAFSVFREVMTGVVADLKTARAGHLGATT